MRMAEISLSSRNDNNNIALQDAFKNVFIDSIRINEKLYSAFSEAYSVYLKTITTLYNNNNNNNPARGFLPESEKLLKRAITNMFDERFREKDFITTLSDAVASYSKLARATGFGQIYQNFSNFLSVWNNNFIDPIRDKGKVAGIYLQAKQVFVESETESISASFPSPESYNLIFLTAALISVSSIAFTILLYRSTSNQSGDIKEIGVPTK